jgi:EEF1A lysine methyltransferase 2
MKNTENAYIEPEIYNKKMVDVYFGHYANQSDEWSSDESLSDCTQTAKGFYFELHLSHPNCVLDIGCGNMRHSIQFCESDYVGIDLVEPKIRFGIGQNSCKFILGNILQSMDAELSKKFDLVIDNGCFHHQHEELFGDYVEKVDSLMAPGALFSLVVWSALPKQGGVDKFGRKHHHFSKNQIVEIFSNSSLNLLNFMDAKAKNGNMQGHYIFSKNA